MPRSGTLVICTQNLDFSGANQVILNIVAGINVSLSFLSYILKLLVVDVGTMHEGNIVILSPKSGPFAVKFGNCGAAVRIGELLTLLHSVRDVFCIICNTIMTG